MSKLESIDGGAERALVGSILLDPSWLDEIDGIVSAGDLANPGLAIMFQAAVDLHRTGTPIDPISVGRLLESHDLLAKVGGAVGIHDALNEVPHADHCEFYASVVRADADRRRAQSVGKELQNATSDRSRDLGEIVAEARRGLDAVEDRGRDVEPVSILDALADWRAGYGEHERATPTGFPELDHRLNGGLRAGNLLVLAARPATGKTALACSLASQLACATQVLFVSCEMTCTELLERLLAAESGLPLERIRTGRLDSSDEQRIAEAQERMAGRRLSIDDIPGQTVSRIAATARRYRRRHGLGLIVVDYLQILASKDKRANRESEVAAMSRGLKSLARELEIPVIALSQLNRAVEYREVKRPRLSDLRESGAIEQDADIVLLLHRAAMHEPGAPDDEAELIIAKNRNGTTGVVRLLWDGRTTRFRPVV
ncbi:Replicative DNA helicase [Maioricimonas rarisocia]|uniref:DNA 5'-3' helicase n=2 Tax=Maioricimonas rarisocia TaxID=2528026 RepID=A0A517Z5C3_9PLAN|nr:Replicative DNA helicase [Maioricimonas rarisocia]